MLGPIIRRDLGGRVRELSLPQTFTDEMIVWSYGGLVKSRAADTVPQVVTFFRKLGKDQIATEFYRANISLTHLGLLRIGSIWKGGVCRSEAVLQEEDFFVDFTNGAWQFASPSTDLNCIGQADYPLRFSRDKNWLLDFSIYDKKNLLIPCVEFLARCYGRSTEVGRILTTYAWEQAIARLASPIDEPSSLTRWPVVLGKDLRNGDAVYVAHVLYDEYTREASKSIYFDLQSAFAQPGEYAFIKIRPWFEGRALIRARGLWINGGRTFLGLQIGGCSDPSGVPIDRDRKNTNKVEKPAFDQDGRAWNGAPERVQKLPEIINLTSDQESDDGTARIDVEEPDFVVLGETRIVVDVRREQARSSSGIPGDGGQPGTFSCGERNGTEGMVGSASIHARPIMESQGVQRDMWNALLFLQKKHPNEITSVEWFTLEDGYRRGGEPELISLQPFDEDVADDLRTDIRNWPHHENGRLRGILVVRIAVKGESVHFLEIQRKPRKKTDQNGRKKDSEESFKGFVCILGREHDLRTWLHSMLLEIRPVKGVVEKLVGKCPGRAAAFNHAPANGQEVPCEAAVINALKKVGIRLSPRT